MVAPRDALTINFGAIHAASPRSSTTTTTTDHFERVAQQADPSPDRGVTHHHPGAPSPDRGVRFSVDGVDGQRGTALHAHPNPMASDPHPNPMGSDPHPNPTGSDPHPSPMGSMQRPPRAPQGQSTAHFLKRAATEQKTSGQLDDTNMFARMSRVSDSSLLVIPLNMPGAYVCHPPGVWGCPGPILYIFSRP